MSQRVGSVEEMPCTFEGKMALLEEILQNGIGKLLTEAKKKGALKPPYGKMPYPTPLISEEEFFKSGAWKEDLEENNEPTFEYNYGFNPLQFLGELVQWAHPSTAVARRDAKKQAFERLRSVGRHALRRFDTLADLIPLTKSHRSGILWGPITTALSCNSVLVLCQPLRSGVVFVQTSVNASFSDRETASTEFNLYVNSDSSDYLRDFVPARIEIGGLTPGKLYYIRCCLKSDEVTGENSRFDGLEDDFFASSTFWTLPSDVIKPPSGHERDAAHDNESDESKAREAEIVYSPVTLWMLDAGNLRLGNGITSGADWRSYGGICGSVPQVSCVLGDAFSSSSSSSIPPSSRSNIFDFHSKCPSLSSRDSILKSTSLFLAWNDVRSGSDVDLRAEEHIYKQYRHDLKKFEKKLGLDKKGAKKPTPQQMLNVPLHVRPNITDSLLAVADAFPVSLNEAGPTRCINRVVTVGTDIQLFICDSRNGYIGKSQAKWLRDELEASQALWKIVLNGVPFGSRCFEVVRSRTEANRSRSASMNPPSDKADLAPDFSYVEEGNGESKVPDSNFRREKSVSMMLPNAVDHDDLDEAGVPKSSIQYVMSSIQKRIDSKNKEGSVDGVESEVSSQVSSKAKLEVASIEDVGMMSCSTILPSDSSILLESGIVVVSSGGITPFVATYDPGNWGRPFLAEVHVGRSSNPSLKEEPYSYMPPSYIYNDNTNGGNYVANVSLAADGALVVSILQGVELAHQSIFRTFQKT